MPGPPGSIEEEHGVKNVRRGLLEISRKEREGPRAERGAEVVGAQLAWRTGLTWDRGSGGQTDRQTEWEIKTRRDRDQRSRSFLSVWRRITSFFLMCLDQYLCETQSHVLGSRGDATLL